MADPTLAASNDYPPRVSPSLRDMLLAGPHFQTYEEARTYYEMQRRAAYYAKPYDPRSDTL